MEEQTSELFKHLSILLAPADLRKVSGEIGKLVKSVQDSVREVEKLDLKAEQTLVDELEKETISFLAGNVYPRLMDDQVEIPWLSVADQETKQNVKNVAAERLKEVNDAYDSLLPHVERYRLVETDICNYFNALLYQHLWTFLKDAEERIGYLYILGKKIPKFRQTELDKLNEKVVLHRTYSQAKDIGEKLRDALLTSLEKSHRPYESVFFTIKACRDAFPNRF